MRLYPNQINAHLKKSLLPAYLFSAEEPLLAQECRDTLFATAQKQGFEERSILHIEQGFNWDHFYELTANLSLFGERKIIDLRFPSSKVDAKASKALLEFCQQPNPDNLLVITLPKLESATQRSKWFKAFDSLGAWLPIKPLTGRHFIDWLEQRSRKHGLQCSPSVIKLIAERVEGNLLAASQELDKLQLLFAEQEGPLTEKHIQTAVSNNARYDLFKWVDTLMAGNASRAMIMLNGLKAEGTEPILLLWAFTRELRQVTQIAETQQRGAPIHQALQQHKVWKNREALVTQAVRRVPLPKLHTLLRTAYRADLAIKGLEKTSPWQLLDEMIILFCQPSR